MSVCFVRRRRNSWLISSNMNTSRGWCKVTWTPISSRFVHYLHMALVRPTKYDSNGGWRAWSTFAVSQLSLLSRKPNRGGQLRGTHPIVEEQYFGEEWDWQQLNGTAHEKTRYKRVFRAEEWGTAKVVNGTAICLFSTFANIQTR